MTGPARPGPGDALLWWSATDADLPASDAWLAPEERAILAGLRVPKRARDFVLGRFTAKHAVVAAMRALGRPPREEQPANDEAPSRTEAPALFTALAILPRADGSPEARFEGGALPVDVSLSHSAGRAFAVVTLDATERIGCDVEHVEPRGPELARDFFTEAEQRALAALDGEALDVATTLVWSAKESALKVLREGLRADTRDVEVALGPAALGHVWSPIATRHVPGGRSYAGAAMHRGAFVFTVSTSGRAPEARLVELPAVLDP